MQFSLDNNYSYLPPNMSINKNSLSLTPAAAVIKLSSLQNFVDKCGGNSALTGMTTTDVYALYWDKAINLELDVAKIFVSFSWEYHFLDVVATLHKLFCNSPDELVWMDFFGIGRNMNFYSKNTISTNQCHHSVLMLTPWNSFAPMKRILCRSSCNCKYDIAVSPADEEELNYVIKELKDCNYAKQLVLLSSEMYKLPIIKIESVWYIPLFSMDANMLSSLVKGLGDGFEICSAIIRYKKITGNIFVNISNEVAMIARLKESGIHSLFHQKVIARNILLWRNRVYAEVISDIRFMNPIIGVEVLSTLEYSNSLSQYPVDGIQVSSLDQFINECGGRSKLQGLTTTDVVKMFIKPLIMEKKSCYCDYLRTIDPSSVGEALVFISHASKFMFLDVVETLQHHFKDTPDVFIWMYEFSMNNFIFIEPDVDDYLWITMAIIKHLKHTVLVLFPWNSNVQPLNSAFILYEIFCTAMHMSTSNDCKFEIAMSPTDKHVLREIVEIVVDCSVESILPTIDCRNSTNFHPVDKIRILYLIETTVGFKDMNKFVSDCMKKAWSSLIKNNDIANYTKLDKVQCLHYLAKLFSSMGKYNESLRYYEECLAEMETLPGPNHPDTLQTINDMAVLCEKMERYDKAAVLYDKCVKSGLDPNHMDAVQSLGTRAKLPRNVVGYGGAWPFHTPQSMKNMIKVRITMGGDTEASFLFKNYIALLEEKLGAGHLDTIAAISEMDVFIDNLPLNVKICVYDVVKSTVGVNGVYSIAYNRLIEKMSVDVELLRNNLNEEHYVTAMRTLGIIRMNQGYFEIAKQHLEELLIQVQKPVLKFLIINDLAVLNMKMGKCNEALDLFTKCLTLWKDIIRNDRLDTSTQIDTSENLLHNCLKYKKVAFFYYSYLALRNDDHTELEEMHPYILNLKNNLAHLKMKMGKYDDALQLFTFCLVGRSEILGVEHPETLAVMNNLAEIYDTIGEHGKAKDLYEKCFNISYRVFQDNHLFKMLITNNLDKLLKNSLKFRNNLPLFTDHMSLREAVLGTTYIDTLQSMNDLRELYKNMGGGHDESMWVVDHDQSANESDGSNPKVAQKYNIVSLAFVEEVKRMKDPDPLTMMNNVAYLYMKLGKYDEALPLFTNCLAIREEVLGKKHPDTLQSIRNLAQLYENMKRYYDAMPLYQKYKSLLLERFGSKHTFCLEAETDIILINEVIGEYDKEVTVPQDNRLLKFEQSPRTNAKLRYGFKYSLSSSNKKSKHTSFVNEICFAGKYIVSASDDMRILVWELKNENIEFLRELRGHSGPIVCLYVIQQSIRCQILSASHDGTIKHWDLDNGICVQTIKHDDRRINDSLAVICNGNYIFKAVRSRSMDSKKGFIHVFSLKNGNYLGKLYEHTDYVRCFAITSAYLFSGSLDKSIRRWDLNYVVRKCDFDGFTNVCSENPTKLLGHADWVRSLCCTKDESRLISGSNDMTVRIWDIQTGETIQILTVPGSRIRCVCMSDDDKRIICGAEDHTIRIWDLETGCPIRILRGHTDWVTSVCCMPSSDKILSCSSDLNVLLWDVYSSPNLFDIPHLNDENKICPVLSLCQCNENLSVTCTKDCLYVWDSQQQYKNTSCQLFSDRMGGEISCICENKTNQSVMICCNYKRRGRATVIEWFHDTRMKSRDYNGIINCICSCTNYIIVGFTQKIDAILIKESLRDKVTERTISMNSVPLTIDCVCVDNSSSSSIYIIIGSQSNDIFVWKCNSQDVTRSFFLRGHTYPVRCLTHSVDINDKYIISGSDDYTLKLWYLPVNDICESMVKITAENSFEGHTLSVLSVICTDELIISGSADKTIKIWSLKARNPLRTLIGHTSDVTGLKISVANHLVSVSKDGTLKVWDLSVGNNVPSDVELQELIRVRHNENGYCEEVTDIIRAMATDNYVSENWPIVEGIANLEEFNRLQEHNQVLKKSKSYNMNGFLKAFQLRVRKSTMDLVPYSAEGEEYETIPLVHWMSRKPHYRDHLLDNILSNHPEVLCSRTQDGKTLFSVVVQELDDPDFTYNCLQILSANLQLKSLEMMWRDYYEIRKFDRQGTSNRLDDLSMQVNVFEHSDNNISINLKETYPLVDVEDIVEALQTLGQVDIIRNGILSLQRAPDKLSKIIHEKFSKANKVSGKPEVGDDTNSFIRTNLQGKRLIFWDSDSKDKFLVRGCSSLFRLEDVGKVCSRRWIIRKCFYTIYSFVHKLISSSENRVEIMEVMYVPFPMRLCQRGIKQHNSSLLLEACIEIAVKEDDASVFESSALTAILTYKLKMFGWYAYCTQCLFCTTLAVHFGYYAFEHLKIDVPIWWLILLFIHSIPVIIMEFLPLHLSSVISINSMGINKNLHSLIFIVVFLSVAFAILWISYDQPGSEYDVILNAIFFLIIFSRAVNNLKYLHRYGLFVRMLLQVLGRMWSYILLLIIYIVGFATTFNILIPTVRRAYDQKCGDTSDSDQCFDMKATTERFQHPVISGVTTYMAMMNTMGWESTAFNISNAYSIYAFIVLVCIFVFLSNVALNITIALMNRIYVMISDNEHASCHLVQAQYVLRVERLLLYFGLIRHDNPKYFPRWILVVCPKTHQSKDDKHRQSVSDDKKGQSVCDDTKHPNDDNIHA